MRISSNDIIAGQPALAIRKLLRHNRIYDALPISIIEEELKISAATAQQVFQDLCKLGYITPIKEKGKETRWHITTKGNALAGASAKKPIKRKTAEKLVQQFLERVENINNSNEYAYYVTQVIIFGSYLSDSPNLGDIDLAITLKPKYNDPPKQQICEDKRREEAITAGRNFKDFFEELVWPQEEVRRILKNRSSSISLHDPQIEAELLKTVPTKILFEANPETNI